MTPITIDEPTKPQGKPLPRSYKTNKSGGQKGCFGKPKPTKLWAASCEQTAANCKAEGDSLWGAIQAQQAVTMADLEGSDAYEAIPTPIEEDEPERWEDSRQCAGGPEYAEPKRGDEGSPNAHIL